MATPKGMGRGLGALMLDAVETPADNTPYRLLPIQKVENNKLIYRENELKLTTYYDKLSENANDKSIGVLLEYKD